jgi:uncharacterized protein YjdB
MVGSLPKRLLLLGVAPLLCTCSESTSSTAPTVATVSITGRTAVYLGQTSKLSAVVISTSGDTLSGQTMTWTSSDTTVATVSGSGLVTSVAVGQSTVQASVGGKAGTAVVSVTLVPVAVVLVRPSRDSLFVGDSLQLVASLVDSAFRDITGRTVLWTTSDSARATVSASGLVRALAPGSVAIAAASEEKAGGAFLTVLDHPIALVLPDTVRVVQWQQALLIPDLRGPTATHMVGPVGWSSLDPAVVQVDSEGVVTPRLIGTGRVQAASGSLADTAVIVVDPAPATRVDIQFYDGVVEVGRPESLEVFIYDAAGRGIDAPSVSWTSSDTSVMRVAADTANPKRGIVTSLDHGVAWIFAISGGLRDSAFQESRFAVAQWRFAPDTLHIPVGQIRRLTAAAYDMPGNVLVFSDRVSPTVIDSGVIVHGIYFNELVGFSPGQARVTGLANDQYPIADTAIVIVTDSIDETVRWEFDGYTAGNYSSLQMRLLVTNYGGGPLPTGRTVVLMSTDTSTLVPEADTLVGVVHDTLITVRTLRFGGARLVATVDSLSASAGVTVTETRPYSVTITPRFLSPNQGDTVRLSVSTLGADGNPYPYPVTWRSSDPASATVSDSGLVSAQAGGRAIITATVDKLTDSTTVLVLSPASPTITGVAPSPITPGTTAVITGTGFDTDPEANSVTIAGVAATVTAGADTQLTVQWPPRGSFGCDTTHVAQLIVGSAGRYTITSAALASAPTVTFDSTGWVRLEPDVARCFKLTQPSPWEVLLSVTNTGRVDQTASFEVATVTLPSQTHPPLTPATEPGAVIGAGTIALRFDRDSLRRAAMLHRRLLEGSRAHVRRWGAPAPLLRAARQAQPARSVAARIGDFAAIRIPALEHYDFCTRYRTIVARLVYRGTHVLVFEDSLAPLRRSMDSYYQAVGQEFDDVMWGVLNSNYGNPLALDSLLDNDGKVAMVFSPVVNAYGIGGFVVSCDFYPETVAPSSNTGEIFYAQVPLDPGTGFLTYTKDVWRWLTRTVVIHESKHLTGFAERLSRGGQPEDLWLEEASAVAAEELWSRTIYGTSWKGDAGYQQTLYCDVRPTFPQCTGRPFSMFNTFAFLHDYATDHEHLSPLGFDVTLYGSGWSLLRWTIDRFAGSEDEFLKALTQETVLSGVDNLAARAGSPIDDILPEWGMSLRLDNNPTPGSPQFPTWNLRSIFTGMSQDFPNTFFAQPVFQWTLVSGGPIGPLPGGTFSLIHQPTGPLFQLLRVQGLGGAPLPANLRVEVMHVP